MVHKFQVAAVYFSCSRPYLNFSKFSSLAVKATETIFPNYTSTLIQKIEIPRSLSQATDYNPHDVFTFTLPLSEGRAGEAWELSNKMKFFFLTQNKVSLTFSIIVALSTFQLYLLPLCLSLCIRLEVTLITSIPC
jgi:hypothetical protein